MSNCFEQDNPDKELKNLKNWKKKEIKFEAKRGRKGRLQRAAEHTRLSGVDFIENHFGLSDQYKKEDKWKILKRVMIMARTQIPPRKISRADFDKWWFDPIIDKERPSYYDDPVKQVAYRQSFHQSKEIHGEPIVAYVKDFDYKNKRQAVTMKVELKSKAGNQKGVDGKTHTKLETLSISGSIWNANHSDITNGGQINDTLRKLLNDGKLTPVNMSKEEFRKLLDVWDRWHLNDLRAGTPRQLEMIDKHISEEQYKSYDGHYEKALQILSDYNLKRDGYYEYGTAWLYEPLPQDVITFINKYRTT